MEKAKKKATVWIVFSALYATVAAILAAGGFFWAEAFVPLICMICAAACFELGRDYQYEIWRGEDEDWLKPEEPIVVDFGCKRCNGMAFRMVAGRYVCDICGEVLEVENGTGET
jgi:hypothetical protein